MKPFALQTFTHVILSHYCKAFIVPPTIVRNCHRRPTIIITRTDLNFLLSSSSSPLLWRGSYHQMRRLYQSSLSEEEEGTSNEHEKEGGGESSSLLDPSNYEVNENVNNLLSRSALSTAAAAITTPTTPTTKSEPPYTKTHCMTVCMVPPPTPEYKHIWKEITKARTELKDPGLYRWPPHVNILYPFIDMNINPDTLEGIITNNDETILDGNNDDDNSHNDNTNTSTKDGDEDHSNLKHILNLLQKAVEQCDPFTVSLDSFGTFGGKHRGVLFISPRSYRKDSKDCIDSKFSTIQGAVQQDVDGNEPKNGDGAQKGFESPLEELQYRLQFNFPYCNDQRKRGTYTPHMTLSHFPSLESALDGQKRIEKWWGTFEFDVHEIYVLKRSGDGGQFKIIATLPLGKQEKETDADVEQSTSGQPDSTHHVENSIDNSLSACSRQIQIQVHDPPLAFPDMPVLEEQWVYEERMKLKERRNNGGGKRRRRRSGRKKKERIERGPSRSTDTPEEIARKRAERAAKKERLAREIALLEQAISMEGTDD